MILSFSFASLTSHSAQKVFCAWGRSSPCTCALFRCFLSIFAFPRFLSPWKVKKANLGTLASISLANRSLSFVLFHEFFRAGSLVAAWSVEYSQLDYFVVYYFWLVASFHARCGALPLPSLDLPVSPSATSQRRVHYLCWPGCL